MLPIESRLAYQAAGCSQVVVLSISNLGAAYEVREGHVIPVPGLVYPCAF